MKYRVVERCLILFVACCLLLAGCWDRVEINDLAIVAGLAIDSDSNNEITVSVLVLSPRSLGAAGTKASGTTKVAFVRSAKGLTIADALSKLQKKLSRKIFLGHCWVYIFGEKVAKAGISDLIDYFARHQVTRNRAQMFVSKGEAFHILELVPPLESHAPDVLREMAKLNVGPYVTLLELTQLMRGEAQAVVLPVMAILPPEGNEKKMRRFPILSVRPFLTRGKWWVNCPASTPAG